MAKSTIGGRPVDITKDGSEIKVMFHPMIKNAKNPNANMFTIKLSKKDLEILTKAL